MLVDFDEFSVRHRRTRIGIQRPDTLTQVVLADHVVGSAPLEILPAGTIKAEIKIGRTTQVTRIAYVANSVIAAGQRSAYFFSPIARSVIGDDQLEVSEILLKDRTDRLLKEGLAIVDRKRQ
jgi:hypothetical protein